MEKGMFRKVFREYAGFFRGGWKADRHSYVRRTGHWVQEVGFQPLTGNSYRAASLMLYLHVPGAFLRPVLPYRLMDRHDMEYDVLIYEHVRNIESVFQKMVEQFWPPVLEPLSEDLVPQIEKRLHKSPLPTWREQCALSILAARRGDTRAAKRFMQRFEKCIMHSVEEWAVEMAGHLNRVIHLAETPDELNSYLNSVETENLKSFKARL